VLVVLMLVLGIGLIAVAALGAGATARMGRFPAAPTSTGPGTTYLVLGSDSRDSASPEAREKLGTGIQAEGARADVVLVVHVAEDHASSTVSVPRDLLVDDDAGNPQRLALTLLHGPGSSARALCRTLGIGVDHVMVVEADALVAAVDGIGGITVTLDTPVRDANAHLDLPAGEVHVDGLTALALARSREPERRIDGKWVAATPDDGAHWRATQTPELMQSIKNQLSGGGWLGAPIAAWRAAPFVAVDDGWRLADFPRLAAAVGSPVVLPTERLGETAVVATEETRTTIQTAGLPACRVGRTQDDRPQAASTTQEEEG
jgi:LCP family protein required for cell wall assembly